MASKNKKQNVVNTPAVVWSTNLPGAFIEVSNLYLWLCLRPGQRKLKYKIDGKRLWEQLKPLSLDRASDKVIPVGDLDVRFKEWEREVVAVIEPPEEKNEEFQFEIEVPLREFKHAVCTFLKF